MQRANFAAAGALYVAGAVGLRRSQSSRRTTGLTAPLIAGAGAGLIGAALLDTDPVSGYPPGTPAQPDRPTRTGALHNLCAIPVFLGISAAALFSARRAAKSGAKGWAAYSAASGALMAASRRCP